MTEHKIDLERQGSIWVFTLKNGNTKVKSIRVQWEDYDTIPNPDDLGDWFVAFGDLFGLNDQGFSITEQGKTLWQYGPAITDK